MTWKPGLASEQKEAEMEALNLPEEERDEVRRMAEFVDRYRDGREHTPLTEEMKNWLLGRE